MLYELQRAYATLKQPSYSERQSYPVNGPYRHNLSKVGQT